MEEAVNVLVIDDSADDRLLYRRDLRESFGDRLHLVEEATGDAGLKALEKSVPHCVLLDYSLPGRNGVEVLKHIRSLHPHLPVVLLTGQGNEAVAVRAMKEGAQDYITKAAINPESLGRIVRMAIETGVLQRRVAEQHVALELFSQALAHDLREPVRTVCSFAEMICNNEIGSDLRDAYMRHIRDAGDRMALLIDSVFSYTQLNSEDEPQREVFNLDDAVSAATANLAALFRERDTAVSVGLLPEVTASRIQVIQVLQNLMANAVDHSPRPVHINIGALHDGAGVRVVVHDNGPGIPVEHQAKIFEPFRRLNRSNAHCGLGLAISRKIVEAHGGKIGCESETAGGATFFFILPGAATTAADVLETAPIAAPPQPENGARVANVLLVDDRDDDVLFTRTFITGPLGMHCNFLVAHDGKSGLDTIRDRFGASDPIDLVLLDINMPVMNGFEMLEAMGEDATLHGIPVVMCSGSMREQDKERSRAMGAVGYLPKPVRFEHLQPIIAKSSCLRLTASEAGQPVLTRVA